MKLAIILGQSDYQNTTKLPACKNDLVTMNKIVQARSDFDQILLIDDSIKLASDAKQRLIDFVEIHKNQNIDEVFFYFSGHGDFDGKEFYYIWNDYNQTKKRQTSLQSTEIDELFRQLNPKLLIKVIDACHSGVAYLKDSEIIEKFLTESKSTFQKCYFFFSSQNDQYSLADSNFSYFSNSFFQSLNQAEGKRLRFKDIIDYISDTFEQSGKQTPFFVTQADFTEIFCVITTQIKEALGVFLAIDSHNMIEIGTKKSNLVNLIMKDAERYVDLATAHECLISALNHIMSLELDEEILECFEKRVEIFEAYDNIPGIKSLAGWLHKNGTELYADVTYETEKYRERVPKYTTPASIALRAASMLFDDDSNYKIVENYRDIPSGFILNIELPHKVIFLTLVSRFPNVLNYSFVLIPILSRTQIYYFYAKLNYIRTDWDTQSINSENVKWSYEVLNFRVSEIKDRISELVQENLFSVILDDLSNKFAPSQLKSELKEEK